MLGLRFARTASQPWNPQTWWYPRRHLSNFAMFAGLPADGNDIVDMQRAPAAVAQHPELVHRAITMTSGPLPSLASYYRCGSRGTVHTLLLVLDAMGPCAAVSAVIDDSIRCQLSTEPVFSMWDGDLEDDVRIDLGGFDNYRSVHPNLARLSNGKRVAAAVARTNAVAVLAALDKLNLQLSIQWLASKLNSAIFMPDENWLGMLADASQTWTPLTQRFFLLHALRAPAMLDAEEQHDIVPTIDMPAACAGAGFALELENERYRVRPEERADFRLVTWGPLSVYFNEHA